MLVVADTSPLNYLVMIGCIDALPHWAEEVDPAPEFLNDPLLASLHDGERAALALAGSRQPIFLLNDWRPRSGRAAEPDRVCGCHWQIDDYRLKAGRIL
jgi:predicted nucleic acid-binding protein